MASLADRGAGTRLRWKVRWRDPEGRSRSKAFERKADAERYMREIGHRLDRGTYLDPNAGRTPLVEIAERHLAATDARCKPLTAHGYRELWSNLIAPRWAAVPVASITHSEVEAWVTELSTRLSGSRVIQAHRILRQMLDSAVHDKQIPSNPAVGVRLPRLVKYRQHTYLTHGQVAALADATTSPRDRAMILTLAYLGLRWGEISALRWTDVDEIHRRIVVHRAFSNVNGHLVEGDTKTHAARTLPLPDHVWAAINDLPRDSEWVFPARGGKPLRNSSWRRAALAPAIQRAKVPALSPHDLRHTAASLAVSSGANVKAIQRLLGHKSAVMTLDVYADLFLDDLEALVGRMTDAARAAPAWVPPSQISSV